MAKVILFRDKSGVDIEAAAEFCVWDNTKKAAQAVEGDIIVITPVRGLFKTHIEWLNAECLVSTFSGLYEHLECEDDFWPSGEGGYHHRYYLDDSEVVKVKDLGNEVLEPLMNWKQGPVRYVRADK